MSLSPFEKRLLRRLQAREKRERGYSDQAILLTWLVAPFGVLVVLAGALVRAAWARADRWLERRSAAQYHRRRRDRGAA